MAMLDCQSANGKLQTIRWIFLLRSDTTIKWKTRREATERKMEYYQWKDDEYKYGKPRNRDTKGWMVSFFRSCRQKTHWAPTKNLWVNDLSFSSVFVSVIITLFHHHNSRIFIAHSYFGWPYWLTDCTILSNSRVGIPMPATDPINYTNGDHSHHCWNSWKPMDAHPHLLSCWLSQPHSHASFWTQKAGSSLTCNWRIPKGGIVSSQSHHSRTLLDIHNSAPCYA